MKNNRKGFTITELVIVIAVIAILATVLIPTFSSIIKKAHDSSDLQTARNIYTEYTAEHDYTQGAPAQNLVIKVGNKYVAVKGGQMQDKIYADLNSAKTAASATVVICDECRYDTAVASGKCIDCGTDCDHGETAVGAVCEDCGKTVSAAAG